jgi:hypothetical protein
MKKAVITVVINDEDGVDLQKIIEAKTTKGLDAAIKTELPKILKNFHAANDFLEIEDNQYIADVVDDIMDGELVYVPSSLVGSGFVQVRYF